MANEKRTNKSITLGSGKLYIKEFTSDAVMDPMQFIDTDIIGYISGGATIEYKPSFYEAKDDLGMVAKTIVTEEEATLKSGVMTWNGKTLEKLSSTATVTETAEKRTVKIGGVGNYNGKTYALCFKHTDTADGDVAVLIRGVNQAGFSIVFAKDKETIIDAEFKCLPHDDKGTLIQLIETLSTPTPPAGSPTK